MLGTGNCIATGNGTDALFLALRAIGVSREDEVITPAFSWISSSETISLCGARPVFTDVDPTTYCLDPHLIEQQVTPRTKAVIAVHLYGHSANLEEIQRICHKYHLFLIEDCAQAHLTTFNGRPVGTFGHVGCFSFYPTKNLGALGDAGCVVTDDDGLATTIRRLGNHGALQKDDHLMEGINSRMDTVQAAVLLAKLPFLKKWNASRQQNAARYCERLGRMRQITVPVVEPRNRHTFHLFVIQAQRRDQLKDYLASQGIETMIHYPSALPNLPAYARFGFRPSDFPVASRLQDDVLSLPVFPGLTTDELDHVCDKIEDFYTSG